MKKKHQANRKDYPDSVIMDALDASYYSIKDAAASLGINVPTMRNWVLKSENITKYLKYKQAEGSVKAREKLEYMLDNLDPEEPKNVTGLVSICKILLDKYEPDLTKQDIDTTINTTKDLNEHLKELLGE